MREYSLAVSVAQNFGDFTVFGETGIQERTYEDALFNLLNPRVLGEKTQNLDLILRF